MSLVIYNTLTHSKQEFVPRDSGKVSIYACGLTPQGPAHLGHMRGALAFDVIRRWFEYRGYAVTMVQNFTDVDDKIIRKAMEEGVSTDVIASRYSAEYRRDWDSLFIKPVTFVKVTENIDIIIRLIQQLFDRGHAYVTDAGDVYLSVSSVPDYGKLSRRRLDEMEAGGRVDLDTAKQNPMDFALWKSERDGEPSWPSPWGKGRPGWHIECSALALHFLGNGFDIHGGGIDLLFPHHENEIAQSEAGTGCTPFARFWMHWGSVNSDGTKMSKSLGNFFTIREILSEYSPQVLRLYLLSTHYRAPIDYAPERLAEAARSFERIRKTISTAEQLITGSADETVTESYITKFEAAMDDDFNSAAALGVAFEVLGELNRSIASVEQNRAEISSSLNTVKTLLRYLGVDVEVVSNSVNSGQDSNQLIEFAIEWRRLAREAKLYALSDRIRDDLKQLGVALEDRPQGTTWQRD
jgi:cysteinyl-tRNA synthetase